MYEGIKKNIYYELRTNDVLIEKAENYIYYTFGRYRIYNYYDWMSIGKLSPETGAFVLMNKFSWDDDEIPTVNDTYAIYIAARNKAEGKEYIDPYRNIPMDVAIKDSTKKFGKKTQEDIADFLPYDMPKQQQLRTIVKMKRLLEQAIKEHYAKQKS
jgi:hypothetical protein